MPTQQLTLGMDQCHDCMWDLVSSSGQSLTSYLVIGWFQIGDTWIHGVGSDASKTSEFLSLQRMRAKLVYDQAQDPAFRNFSRLLLKVALPPFPAFIQDRARTCFA